MKSIFFAAFLFLAGTSPSEAAGIDCAKAESPREKMVCSDPKLLKLDADMATLYAERLQRLSAEGQKLQRKVQVSWLRYVDTICYAENSTARNKFPDRCLKELYQDRKRDLDEVGQMKGPYIFNNIAVYEAKKPKSDQNGSDPGFYTLHLTYPQIDNIRTSQAQAFNLSMVRKDTIEESCGSNGNGDVNAGFYIGAVADNLIALSDSVWEYCHGTPHGHDVGNSGKLVEFSARPRELSAVDVFGSGNEWQAKLSHLVETAISFESPEEDNMDVRNSVISSSMELSNWFISEKGFERIRSSYDGGCYACRMDIKTIPWSDIKPLLPPNSPLWRFVNQAK